jgi:hypothetical protein
MQRMTTAQIVLTESENRAIEALSQSEKKSREEILHEAVEQFLLRHQVEHRLAALRQARGIWKERQDSTNLTELRDEWNRV